MSARVCILIPFVLSALALSCSAEAPNFRLKTAAGKTIELQDLQGKVVVVNFWATWCPPCRMEIPGMLEVYRKYRSRGLEIIGIALDQDGWNKVSPLVRDMNIDYPIVLGDPFVTKAYGGIRAIPTTVIVNKDGTIADKHVGFFSKENFEAEISEML